MKKVYVINLSETDFEFRKAEQKKDFNSIMTEAEKLGTVYSLKGFQKAFNDEFINPESFIYIN